MKFLDKLFGIRRDQVPTKHKSLEKLRKKENTLVKKQETLEFKIYKERNTARQNAYKNRKVALQAIKRKKALEKELQEINGTLSTVELQLQTLESMDLNTQVLMTMKTGADAHKAALKIMDVDIGQDAIEDIDVISTSTTLSDDVDDKELALDLDKMELKNDRKPVIDVADPHPSLPDVPKHVLSRNAKNKTATAAPVDSEDDYNTSMKFSLLWDN